MNKELIFKLNFDSYESIKEYERLVLQNYKYQIHKIKYSINLLKNIIEYDKNKYENDIVFNGYNYSDSLPIFKTSNITMNFKNIEDLVKRSLKKQNINIKNILIYNKFNFDNFDDFNNYYNQKNKIKKIKYILNE